MELWATEYFEKNAALLPFINKLREGSRTMRLGVPLALQAIAGGVSMPDEHKFERPALVRPSGTNTTFMRKIPIKIEPMAR